MQVDNSAIALVSNEAVIMNNQLEINAHVARVTIQIARSIIEKLMRLSYSCSPLY